MAIKSFKADSSTKVGQAYGWRADQKNRTLKELAPLIEKYDLKESDICVTLGSQLMVNEFTETEKRFKEDLVKKGDRFFRKTFRVTKRRKEIKEMLAEINPIISDCCEKALSFDHMFHIVITSPIYKTGLLLANGEDAIVKLDVDGISEKDQYILDGLVEITEKEYDELVMKAKEERDLMEELKWKK